MSIRLVLGDCHFQVLMGHSSGMADGQLNFEVSLGMCPWKYKNRCR